MHELVESLWIVVGVLIVGFLGPAIAIAFLLWRKRRVRTRRRSPVPIDLLRSPGHTLREEMDEAQTDLLSDLFLLVVMPLAFLSILLAYGHVRGLAYLDRLAPVVAVAAIGFMAFMLRKLWLLAKRLDRLRTGYDAELAVGQELHQLMRRGARRGGGGRGAPGWWVERTARGEVQVLNAKELGYRLLKSGVAPSLSPVDMRRIEHQLDQRCRTIAPRDATK